MYDFILGDKATILKNAEEEKKFLLSVKRMLPRWCNSIPDSEFLAIYDILADVKYGGGGTCVCRNRLRRKYHCPILVCHEKRREIIFVGY